MLAERYYLCVYTTQRLRYVRNAGFSAGRLSQVLRRVFLLSPVGRLKRGQLLEALKNAHHIGRIRHVHLPNQRLINSRHKHDIRHGDSLADGEAVRRALGVLCRRQQRLVGVEPILERRLGKAHHVRFLVAHLLHAPRDARVGGRRNVEGNDADKVAHQRAGLGLADGRQQRVRVREAVLKVLEDGERLPDGRLFAVGVRDYERGHAAAKVDLILVVGEEALVCELDVAVGERDGLEVRGDDDALAAGG